MLAAAFAGLTTIGFVVNARELGGDNN